MDRYRPIFHFTPRRNWMNDPNGPFHLNGEYHLFYQHNPFLPEWGDIHWGHATSPDLVNWTRKPIALTPSRELGEWHCYSGCAVIDGDEVKLFYSSIGRDERNATTGAQQWMAKSKDLQAWQKPVSNPLLTSELHGDVQITEWRDPFVWKDVDGWKMIVGGIHEGKGCAFLYHSDDLESWSYQGIFHRGEEWIWECLHLFRFGEKTVLFYSPSAQVRYITGTINADGALEADYRGTADYAGFEGYYASSGFVDEQGRCVLLGWMPEGRGEDFPEPAEWAGALALPRLVSLNADGSIRMSPLPELSQLRGERQAWDNVRLGAAPVDAGMRSNTFECALELEGAGGASGAVTLSVLQSPCGRERTDIVVDFSGDRIVIDRSQSSLFLNTHKTPVEGKLPSGARDSLELRIFVDRSTVEVFANEETCLSARVYPSLADSDGIQIRSDGEVLLKNWQVWAMNSAAIG
ncbi:glycoside hydrolase family 32 protein [Cohnella cellulosilytica]|uniref:beta-fructofuranosidase n=1 Tax=Cohnella cellulosilytica TaxID=986710 RepID=A0ABW2F946_9BACL